MTSGFALLPRWSVRHKLNRVSSVQLSSVYLHVALYALLRAAGCGWWSFGMFVCCTASSITRAADGRIVRGGIISSCPSAATFEIAKRFTDEHEPDSRKLYTALYIKYLFYFLVPGFFPPMSFASTRVIRRDLDENCRRRGRRRKEVWRSSC